MNDMPRTYREEPEPAPRDMAWLLPAHIALTLLPLGQFQKDHADHLFVIIVAAELMAKRVKAHNTFRIAKAAEELLAEMSVRSETDVGWTVSEAETKQLIEALNLVDQFIRMQPNRRVIEALSMIETECLKYLKNN